MTDQSFELPVGVRAATRAIARGRGPGGQPRRGTLVLEAPGPGGRRRPDPGGRRGADRRRRPGQARRDGRELPRRGHHARRPRARRSRDKVNDIGKLGDDDIRASAAVSNRLLDKPLAAMQNGGADRGVDGVQVAR